uniref:Putative sp15 family member n=1 Tax=Nyssomyia neivai TaxID=330878 RepID=A0A1L8DPD2_9DIPT
MKYSVFVVLAIFYLIKRSRANHPQQYCIDKLAETEESCIQHCRFSYYGFTNDKFQITKKHIEKFRDILLEFNAVPKSKKNQLFNHIKKCADKVNSLKSKDKSEKCMKILTYSRCVADNKTVSEHNYVTAILAHDKRINV